MERRNALKLAGVAVLELATTRNSPKASDHPDPDLVRYYKGVTALHRYRDRRSGSLAVAVPVVEHVNGLLTRLRQTSQRDPAWPDLAVATADAAQLAGWLSFDQLEWDAAYRWYELTGMLALKANDLELHANSLLNLARVQVEGGRQDEALASLERVETVRVSRATEANIMVHRAHALVAAGQEQEALAAFDAAHETLEKADSGDRPPPVAFMSHMSPGHIQNWKGHSFIQLGRPKQAIPSLEAGLADMSPTFRRSKGECFVNLGYAYLDAGELDEACAMLARAYPILTATKSRRHLRTFARLHGRLVEHRDAKAVWHLNEVVRAYSA